MIWRNSDISDDVIAIIAQQLLTRMISCVTVFSMKKHVMCIPTGLNSPTVYIVFIGELNT